MTPLFFLLIREALQEVLWNDFYLHSSWTPRLIYSQNLKIISPVESFLCPDKQGTPEEGTKIQRPKFCKRKNNKDEDNSPKTLTDKNHYASSQKFRQEMLIFVPNFGYQICNFIICIFTFNLPISTSELFLNFGILCQKQYLTCHEIFERP